MADGWESFPDAPSDWDSFPDEAPVATPTPDTESPPMPQILDDAVRGGANLVGDVANKTLENIQGVGQMAAAAPGFAWDVGNRTALNMRNGMPGFMAASQAIGDKLGEMIPPEQRLSAAVRFGGSMLGTVAGGMAPGLLLAKEAAKVPARAIMASLVGGVLGDKTGQQTLEWFGVEEPTPLREKFVSGVSDLITATAVPKVLEFSGWKGGEIIKAMRNSPLSPTRRLIEMSKERGVLAAKGFGVGARNLGTERMFFDDLKQGEKIYAKINPGRGIEGPNGPDRLVSSIESAITQRYQQKQAAIRDIDSLVGEARASGKNIPLIKGDDLDLAETVKRLGKRKDSMISQMDLSAQKELLDKIGSRFESSIAKPDGGFYKKDITLGEAQAMLDVTYENLRSLRHFDYLSNSNAMMNPSQAMQFAAQSEVYQDLAGALRKRITQYSKETFDHFPKELASKGYKRTSLPVLNEEIHALLPFLTAAERMAPQKMAGIIEHTMASLNANVSKPASQVVQALEGAASARLGLGSVNEGIQDAIHLGKIRAAAPQIDRLSQAINGEITLGPMARGVDATLDATTGGLQGAGAALASAPGMAAQITAYDFYNQPPQVTKSYIDSLPVMEETKAMLEQAIFGTREEQFMALGQAKKETLGMGTFEPSPIPGINTFIATPEDSDRIGVIPDQMERKAFESMIDKTEKSSIERAKLKSALVDGSVIKIPDKFKRAPSERVVLAPTIKPETVEIDSSSGGENSERVEQPY
jgi:hypothetical protein